MEHRVELASGVTDTLHDHARADDILNESVMDLICHESPFTVLQLQQVAQQRLLGFELLQSVLIGRDIGGEQDQARRFTHADQGADPHGLPGRIVETPGEVAFPESRSGRSPARGASPHANVGARRLV